MMNLSVTWGDLALSEAPYIFAADPEWGSGVLELETLTIPNLDGDRVTSHRVGNREIEFAVWVEGATIAEVEMAAAQLELQASRSASLLTVSAGDEATPWATETYEATLLWDRTDAREAALMRRYVIQCQAYPHVRALDPVLVPAIGSGGAVTPIAPTVTTVWDGATAAGWVASPAPLVGSSAPISTSAIPKSGLVSLTRTGTFSLSGTPWLSVRTGGLLSGLPRLMLNEGLIRFPTLSTGDNWHHWWVPDIASVTSVRLVALAPKGGALWTSSITRQNVMPWADTARQIMQAFPIHGTARTQGSIHIGHASQGLGMTLVHCQADDGSGALPPVRRYRVTGGSAPASVGDSTAISGQRTILTAGVNEVFRVPASQVPRGLYMLVTRLWSDVAQTRTITQATSTRHAGSQVGTVYAQRQVTLAANAWTWVDLNQASLPPTPVPAGSTAEVSIAVSVDGDVGLDDLWLMNISTGSVVRVDAGSFRHMWIDTPTIDEPLPTIWVGMTADKTAARHIDQTKIHTWQVTRWEPGRENAFTACSAEGVAVDGAYWRRFQHNATPLLEEAMS